MPEQSAITDRCVTASFVTVSMLNEGGRTLRQRANRSGPLLASGLYRLATTDPHLDVPCLDQALEHASSEEGEDAAGP